MTAISLFPFFFFPSGYGNTVSRHLPGLTKCNLFLGEEQLIGDSRTAFAELLRDMASGLT